MTTTLASPDVTTRVRTSASPDRALWDALPPDVRARYADAAEGRLSVIKPYQLEQSALTALKGSAINASRMGGGKTLMALFHAFAINAVRTAVIVPTRIFDVWRAECARVKIPCVTIANATDARNLRRELWRQRKAGIKPSTITVYLISWEWLCLGGESNRTYDPWYARLKVESTALTALKRMAEISDRAVSGFMATITQDSVDAMLARAADAYQAEVEEAKTACRQKPEDWTTALRGILAMQLLVTEQARAAETAGVPQPLPLVDLRPLWDADARRKEDVFDVRVLCESPSVEALATEYRRIGLPIRKGQPYQYEAHQRTCPKCGSKAPTWHGNHCKSPECQYDPRSFRSKPQCVSMGISSKKTRQRFQGQRVSVRSFPGYRLLPKFDLKIVDEFHKVVSLATVHGQSIFDVDATNTLLLSGTICRSYVTELEPALALVHEQNSPEFPYSRHDLSDFRNRFSSSSVRLNITRRNRPTIISRAVVPEASNINALRRMLLTRMVTVDDSVIEAEWGLGPTPERLVPFPLIQDEVSRYNQVLDSVLSWRNQLVTLLDSNNALDRAQARTALARGVRNRLDMVAAIVNGPSKIAAAVAWVRQESVAGGHRVMVVCRSVPLFKELERAFKAAGFNFAVCDEKVSNDERSDFLTDFAESRTPILLTRIKLVAEAFNQLVCCTRQLMCEVERSPSDNRQFQKRMNRPGQRSKDIRCDLLVAALPNGEASIDEIDIRRFLRKERAIHEVTSRKARFRGAAALLQAAQEKRGMLHVLDDLASRVLSEVSVVDVAAPGLPPAATVSEPSVVSAPPAELPTPHEALPSVPIEEAASNVCSLEELLALVPASAPEKRARAQRKPTKPALRKYMQCELPL